MKSRIQIPPVLPHPGCFSERGKDDLSLRVGGMLEPASELRKEMIGLTNYYNSNADGVRSFTRGKGYLSTRQSMAVAGGLGNNPTVTIYGRSDVPDRGLVQVKGALVSSYSDFGKVLPLSWCLLAHGLEPGMRYRVYWAVQAVRINDFTKYDFTNVQSTAFRALKGWHLIGGTATESPYDAQGMLRDDWRPEPANLFPGDAGENPMRYIVCMGANEFGGERLIPNIEPAGAACRTTGFL